VVVLVRSQPTLDQIQGAFEVGKRTYLADSIPTPGTALMFNGYEYLVMETPRPLGNNKYRVRCTSAGKQFIFVVEVIGRG
jgi:hypothetical protein